jgi:hypothetical protein
MHARIDDLACQLANETMLDLPIVDDRFQQVMIIGGDHIAGICTTTLRTIQNLRHHEMMRGEVGPCECGRGLARSLESLRPRE